MTISLLTQNLKEQYADEILDMIRVADKDFVPPLSARSSTTQSDLKGVSSGGVENYFSEMMKQEILGAFEENKLLGIVSFRDNYESDVVKILPNIYISTLFVHSDARGRGLTKILYSYLFDLYSDRSVFTRTWSTNIAHIKILEYFGFTLFLRLENDRGEGIDTVYFKKEK